MNVIIRFVSLVLVVTGFAGCSPMIGQPGYGEYPAYQSRPVVLPERLRQVELAPQRYYAATAQPDRTWLVDTSSPINPSTVLPEGVVLAYKSHGDLWVVNGKIQPKRVVFTTTVPGHYNGSYAPVGFQPGVGGAPLLAGIGAESAAMLLRELEAGGSPCTAKNHTSNVTVGSVIGGLVGAVLTGELRGVIFGGLVGASGGSAEAKWNCVSYTRTRMALLSVIDAAKARCKSTLSQTEVNGVVQTTKTKECAAVEAMDFERIGQGQPITAPAVAPVRTTRVVPARLRDATPEKPPK